MKSTKTSADPLSHLPDLRIDPHTLDKEWIRQPDLVGDYGAALSNARRELDDASTAVGVISAELDASIRDRPGKFGIDKLTEGAIKQAIQNDESYQAACSKVNEIKHLVNLLGVAMTRLEHRKKALENLTELHFAGYYAEPTPKQRSQERLDEMKKRRVRKPYEDDDE